ncbi:MAG TPA: hypothetical protein PK668_25415 [Myxococcota bacterium]|nr:hypothetical protein [Myxococcota bacterium]HRY95238.1 hypothetical protein [Myxococcota bacterium]HSA20744.1 hypothetical protein [Myxococcota bacterium]
MPTGFHTLRIAICTALGLLAAGCDGGQDELPGEEIDCLWFEQVDNCWKLSLEAAAACTPAAGTHGMLSADGTSCSYADGVEIVFTNPVDLQADLTSFDWDFSLRRDGDPCVSFRRPDTRLWVLETTLGLYRMFGKGYDVGIECPDGGQFKVTTPGLLQLCDEDHMPIYSASWDATGLAFALGGSGHTALQLVFDCRPAP